MFAFDIKCSSKQLKDVVAASAFVNGLCIKSYMPHCILCHNVMQQGVSLTSTMTLFVLFGTACPGPPEAPTLDSNIPPNVDLSWSSPSASGAWSYTYEVSWTNGSVILPRQAGTTGQIPGLQAETEYTVEITAYPDSTLCPDQATTFMFMTTQSKRNYL